MTKFQLPEVDLLEYSQKIREVFNIYEVKDDEIDYITIQKLPTEIERRRALFQSFIPDVFAPGQYDRRADLIDGCIYLIELIEKTGNQSLILKLWIDRTNINQKFNYDDLEEDSYGYQAYHPVFNILGRMQHLEYLIPRLVKHIRSFSGRKRKLDLNDYALIFLGVLSSMKPMKISPKMLKFMRYLIQEVNKQPLTEAINFKRSMEAWGFKNIHDLHAKVNKIGFNIHSLFEKRIFGLESFAFYCPYPYHVRVRTRRPPYSQVFLTGGKQYTQLIWIIAPTSANINSILRKFPKQTTCYRTIRLPCLHQDPLKFFNTQSQDWEIPWDALIAEWRQYLNETNRSNTPVKLIKPTIKPSEAYIKICDFLELEGNSKNAALRRHLKIPKDQIKQIRYELDMNALITRTLVLYYNKLTDFTVLTLPGDQEWKRDLLQKLGEASINYTTEFLEELRTSEKYLRGYFLLTPRQGIKFHISVNELLQDELEYQFRKQMLMLSLGRRHWVDLFDPDIQGWRWNPDDVNVSPLSIEI